MQHREDYILDLYFLRDERAVTETQREYGSFCLDLALRILGRSNREDAEECVNDAYLALWRSIPPKRPKPLKAYLVCSCTFSPFRLIISKDPIQQ